MHKVTEKHRRRFYEVVKQYHNKGMTFIEAICKVMDLVEINDREIVKLIGSELREEVKKEAIDKHLIKCKRAENLESIFYGDQNENSTK